uniref:Ig-like domain-containing protein n=1 Tax=Naja naja TaxID=35670 RepID=A0A8C6XD16_NAJNA
MGPEDMVVPTPSLTLSFGFLLGSLHSLKHFSTCTSDSSQGQPHFFFLGYVDDQVFVHYESNSQEMQPRVPWVEEAKKENPQLWGNLSLLRTHETICLSFFQGFHTLQWMFGCELRGDGSKGEFLQYGYDGRTFITFDKETLTWVAHQPLAEIIKRKWDDIPGSNQKWKSYLEEECIQWLQNILSYGRMYLLPGSGEAQSSFFSTDSPVVTVSSRMEAKDGMETHVCQIHGFYPKAIDASWRRDGEVWKEETFHGSVALNADGTYHYWLSIRIYPKDRDRYRCHVEHNGLEIIHIYLFVYLISYSFIFCISGLSSFCILLGYYTKMSEYTNQYTKIKMLILTFQN